VYVVAKAARVKFTARQKLLWVATIMRGLLDLVPAQLPGLFGDLSRSRRRLVVMDAMVHALYGKRIFALLDRYGVEYPEPLIIPGGEASKTAATVKLIHAYMERHGVPRETEPLLAFGGGVLHDLVGAAAAQYRRGVPYIMFGTTLVAMVDAMFALKSATNDFYKNRLGYYHPPIAAYSDPLFFATLTHEQVLDGVGEMFKAAVALDRKLFRLLRRHGARLVAEKFQGEDRATLESLVRAVRAMARELSGNPYERVKRRASYAGHNVSPKMEPAVTHGAAVALDLLVTTMIAWRRRDRWGRRLVSTSYRNRIVELARSLGLQLWHAVLDDREALLAALADTALHREGEQLVPAPFRRPGRVVYLNGIGRNEFGEALDDYKEWVLAA
jgi:3-dehydroquinate synthetase